MIKKLSLYLGLIIFFINLSNNNLFKFYSFMRQRVIISGIKSETKNICKPLQNKIEEYISDFREDISISVLNKTGEFIIDINSDTPRIPASNQKILSSAFSLDNLGPNFTLNTSLNVLSDGTLFIEASGDPDFGQTHLRTLISILNTRKYNSDLKVPILVVSNDESNWWPSSWSLSDRNEEYGAPITKYSIASNSSTNALKNPILNFSRELDRVLKVYNLSDKYKVITVIDQPNLNHKKTINTIYSAPLYILLNLVNSESHNFTSEVIFRTSLNNWSHNFPNEKYLNWLKKQNFNYNNFVFADASGLSRDNRVTTYGLSQFLRRMRKNRYSEYYFSSFSILGVRGSLSKVDSPLNLKGKILAKSGTLNNVKSISGMILGEGIIFSIIVNNMDNSLKYIIDLLSIIRNTNNSCI